MSEKVSYTIFLSVMALFAAMAAHAKEPAATEHSAVLAAVRSGDAEARIAALMKYNDALTKAFTPKKKVLGKAISQIATAQPVATTNVSVAKATVMKRAPAAGRTIAAETMPTDPTPNSPTGALPLAEPISESGATATAQISSSSAM